MNVQDKLEALIAQAQRDFLNTEIDVGRIEKHVAQHLAKNGVVVMPCRVGDKLYEICDGIDGEAETCISEITVTEIGTNHIFFSAHMPPKDDMEYEITFDKLGDTVFFSREEAERALEKRGENVGHY